MRDPPLGTKISILDQVIRSVGSNTPGAASSAADLEAQAVPKSRPKPKKNSKTEAEPFENPCHFGGSWASKSAALLAAPGVLDPTAFYACINILL